MNKANLHVNSREYKVMFKPKEFVDINKGIEKVVETVASRINKQDGIFKGREKSGEEKNMVSGYQQT
jgi:hypothetical protein